MIYWKRHRFLVEESLGSFSFDVTKRILCTLYQNGSTKRTSLAAKTRLNYNVCLRYVNMLKRLGWLDGDTEISITGTGKNVMMRLTNEISGYQSKKASEVSPSENLYTDSVTNYSNQQNISISNLPTQDPAHNLHIMIVDDEPDVLVTYESFLSHAGYDVKAFVDSYQALKAFASEPMIYDLIILDIRMENLNGLQLYQCMKAMNQYSKIIFISALDATKELATMIPGISSQEILKKPIDKENFLRSIKIALA